MYTALLGRLFGNSSLFSSSFSAIDGFAEGVLASGRPAKGLFLPAVLSPRRAMVCAGIVGILLLWGKGGRPLSVTDGVFVFSVSVRLKLPNFEGGGGREPIGRVLFARRSFR